MEKKDESSFHSQKFLYTFLPFASCLLPFAFLNGYYVDISPKNAISTPQPLNLLQNL
ncbi:MAG: hypothetical protein F6K65_03655 [Moorea sp. SIO3C2]|nr:hypothetical protein [Moorena sp. SIO3C2]